MSGYYCYIIACADGSYYTGWTTDPKRRLQQHSAGNGSKYTRSRRPLKLVYLEPFSAKHEAMARESAIKKYSRPQKQKLIEEHVLTLQEKSTDD
ncbi:MAG: GIY-YIG nuclease family protein [Anaerolineales bacterium]|nr:GIY-YIG nuclease family protein [Anaerolineales bacterium]